MTEIIGIVGSGTMGNGIAQVAARAGYNVVMRDVSAEFLERGMKAIDRNLQRDVDKERLTSNEKQLVIDRIKTTTELEAFKEATFVIEAVTENFAVKTDYQHADIGVAVAVEEGLITPIIRAADQKSLSEIAGEVRELAGRARERKLKPEEYMGASFSISNLGMFGIDEFTAVINPPEGAILAIGAMSPKPVVRNDEIVVRQMMRVTMSCDHRLIDGATGAKFLQTFKKILENPLYLVV